MKTILHLSSSIDLENSTSREVGGLLVQQLRNTLPSATVIRRDLARQAPPHIGPAFFCSLSTPDAAALRESRTLATELKTADLLVLESPMYNFGIPSTLKAWIDHIVRADLTFKVGAHGREGLLQHLKAVLVLGSGGVYAEGPARLLDHQEPYLRTILGFVGIPHIVTIHIDGTAYGPEARAASLANARLKIGEVLQRL